MSIGELNVDESVGFEKLALDTLDDGYRIAYHA
jgi:hypothetical protein